MNDDIGEQVVASIARSATLIADAVNDLKKLGVCVYVKGQCATHKSKAECEAA
jgi:hypothetical protein